MGEPQLGTESGKRPGWSGGRVCRMAVILDRGDSASVEVLVWNPAIEPGYRFAARGGWWEVRRSRSLERSVVAVPVGRDPQTR